MFALRHLGRGTFHPENRFHIEGGWHWIRASLSIGFWSAMLWGAWHVLLLVNAAVAQAEDLTRGAPIADVSALFVVVLIATVAAFGLILDVAARLVAELCLWTASSLWRFRGVRSLSATVLAGVERRILRRTPEWRVEMTYPRPRRNTVVLSSLVEDDRFAVPVGKAYSRR